MAMNEQHKRLLEKQMETLDYIKGKGLFPKEKRSANQNHRYLIISYGGTGSDALYPVKKLLEDELPEEEYKSHVRILAVDTDKKTRVEQRRVVDENGQATTEDVDRFTPSEFHWLDCGPARQAMDLDLYDDMKGWINPRLPATIKSDATYLNGDGASSTRQVGRVLLAPSKTYQDFTVKLNQLIGELTHGNADPLKIYIISGIAGGTGSGIVIDATYIIRHTVEQIGTLANRTSICGFIMLPPTGNSQVSVDIEKGNRNGIAALKEIDHFMTITKRGERYSNVFGGSAVVSDKNIFDACYLLDGSTANVTNANPREKAVEVIKNCILDMITSQPIVGGAAAGIQDVASFMSDTPAFAEALVSGESENVAPREANYIYCAIGHGMTRIPLELMKAYVAKHVFDKMHRLFKNCENVEAQDVEKFLDKVGCPSDGRTGGATKKTEEELRGAVNQEVAVQFAIDPENPGKKGGPYYVINLLNAASKEVSRRKETVNGYTMANKKKERAEQFEILSSQIRKHNSNLFEVYVTVLEELKKHLQESSKILCDSTLFRSYYNSSYTFTPIDFGNTKDADNIVKKYLDKLINGVRVDKLCSELVQEMLNNRAAWTELVITNKQGQARFSAPQRIRQFWQSRISKIVDASLEDYLIKYYSGDPNAKWEVVNGAPTPAADAALKTAAKSLVDTMWGNAGAAVPLAELKTSILIAEKFNGKKSLLIPKGAPHLIQYVKAELASRASLSMRDIKVAESTSNDSISCYGQFTNIPAYMFSWATRAEPHYEKAIRAANVGLHMSETNGGALWRNFPNLVNEAVWDKVAVGYTNPREADLNQDARDIFTKAQALGLAELRALATTNSVGYYTVSYLPANFTVDPSLLKAVDSEMDGTPAKKSAQAALDAEVKRIAEILFSKKDWTQETKIDKSDIAVKMNGLVNLETYSLNLVNTVMTPLILPGATKPEGWEEKLASALLRTTPEYCYKIRASVLVLDRVYEMISAVQKAAENLNKFAHYLVADLFTYIDEEGTWYYADAEGIQRCLLTIPYTDKAMAIGEYYFMFKAFEKNIDALSADLDPQYDDLLSAGNLAEGRAKQKEMAEKAAAVLAKVVDLMTYDRSQSSRDCIASAIFEKHANARGYDVEAIRGFYADLKNNLSTFDVILNP